MTQHIPGIGRLITGNELATFLTKWGLIMVYTCSMRVTNKMKNLPSINNEIMMI